MVYWCELERQFWCLCSARPLFGAEQIMKSHRLAHNQNRWQAQPTYRHNMFQSYRNWHRIVSYCSALGLRWHQIQLAECDRATNWRRSMESLRIRKTKINSVQTIFIGTKSTLTFTEIFTVLSSRFAVIDQWSFAIQIRRRTIRQCLVIQMVQTAIVLRSLRLSQIDERTAQKFGFNFAGQTTRWLGCHLQFFVGVVVETGILGYLFVGDADTWLLENTRILASLWWFQAQILEIIGSLGVN